MSYLSSAINRINSFTKSPAQIGLGEQLLNTWERFDTIASMPFSVLIPKIGQAISSKHMQWSIEDTQPVSLAAIRKSEGTLPMPIRAVSRILENTFGFTLPGIPVNSGGTDTISMSLHNGYTQPLGKPGKTLWNPIPESMWAIQEEIDLQAPHVVPDDLGTCQPLRIKK